MNEDQKTSTQKLETPQNDKRELSIVKRRELNISNVKLKKFAKWDLIKNLHRVFSSHLDSSQNVS